jgi:membrane-associated protein
MPLLPGDSLIFVAGAFAAQGLLNVAVLWLILVAAAIIGDSVNYWIGNSFGKVILRKKVIKEEYLEKTNKFYERHGGKTIIFARFVPIVRTIAPFVAGLGKMNYSRFLAYNVIGGLAWVTLFLFAGFFFGAIPIIKNNLSTVIFIIIFISILPPIIEYVREKRRKN